jgi:ABC-2 type transport system ATP-binding protein
MESGYAVPDTSANEALYKPGKTRTGSFEPKRTGAEVVPRAGVEATVRFAIADGRHPMHAPNDSTATVPDGQQPAVTITNLVKRYGSFVAVDEVSFSIQEGEIFGIIGPNGAGKTTTVECISGLRVPDSGSISIYRLSPQRDRDKVREFLGVQLQESALPPRLKVGEALKLFAAFYENPLDPQEVLESLGIHDIERAAFKNLSGGQKQRVSIALALVGNPRIAILDELTTGLDPEARRGTWALIERMRERGVTVILVTHFMDEAETLCDRLALINRGRLAALDTPEAIAAGSGMNRVRFVPSQPVQDDALYAVDGVRAVERKGRFVTVTGTGDLAESLISTLAASGVHASELEARHGNLDDAFIRLTRETAPATAEEVQS